MSIESFDDLSGRSNDDTVKNATLQTLHALFYGDSATSPDDVAQFTEQVEQLLTSTHNLATDDTKEVLDVLTAEITSNHNGSATRFATTFLSASNWLTAEETFSDASSLFQEMWLDEATGLYYDALGNWYDAERNPVPTAGIELPAEGSGEPELWTDESTGLLYDAAGNWYDQDRRPLRTASSETGPAETRAPADTGVGDRPSAEADAAGEEPPDAEMARTAVWNEIPALAGELGISEEVLRAEFSKLTLEEIDAALRGELTAAD